jgi:phosphoribosylglycinamide formyltransferase-1
MTMKKPIRIATLISGGGSNLEAIINACRDGLIDGRVVVVGSDNPDAKGLDLAASQGIPTFVVNYAAIIKSYQRSPQKVTLPDDFDYAEIAEKQTLLPTDTAEQRLKAFLITRSSAEAELLQRLKSYPFDLLVLAGFMRNLTPYFIDRVNTATARPRIMNIHPSLLPAFAGVDGYGDTFRYGCKVAGCTVHFIDYGEDSGPIIAQRAFAIDEDDTIESVKKKGLQLEWQLYPECVQLFARGRLKVFTRTFTLKNGATVARTAVKILPKMS